MNRHSILACTGAVALGMGLALGLLAASKPALAQYPYACPLGYYYDARYGCVPTGYLYEPPYYPYPYFGFDYFYGGGWGGRPHGGYRGGGHPGGAPHSGGTPHGGGAPHGGGGSHGGGGRGHR